MADPKPEKPIAVAGPFRGVRDSIPLATQDMTRLAALVNGYIRVPEIGDDVTCRPGFLGGEVTGVTGVPAGITITGPIYATVGYRHTDGVYWNLLLVGITIAGPPPANAEYFASSLGSANPSAFVRWSPGTGAYSWAMKGAAVTSIHLLDPTAARLFFTPFAGYLISSDGINRLTKWTPANVGSGTDTVSNTATADAVYGQPTVYAGKLFYIMKTARNTLKWSNENDPDTGYVGAQAWDFVQTSSSPLTRLFGTNNALLIYRVDSITTITGLANSDFRSAATFPSVNMTIGTRSPSAVCAVYDEIWHWDQFGPPQKVVPGAGVVPLYFNCMEQITSIARADTSEAALYQAWAIHIPNLDIVVLRYQYIGGSNAFLVFHARTSEYLGTWEIPNSFQNVYGAEFRDANDLPCLAIPLVNAGPFFLGWNRQKQDDSTTVMKDEPFGTLASQVAVAWTTPFMAGDVDLTKNFTRMVVTTRRFANATMPTLTGTPQGSVSGEITGATFRQITPGGAGVTDRPGRAVLMPTNQIKTRWLKVAITTNTAQTTLRPAIGEIRVYGTTDNIDYDAP